MVVDKVDRISERFYFILQGHKSLLAELRSGASGAGYSARTVEWAELDPKQQLRAEQ